MHLECQFLTELCVCVCVCVLQAPILRDMYYYSYRAAVEVFLLFNLRLVDPIVFDPRKDRRIIR